MRIVVAMSGGVDSSTVAGLLHEAGHEVIGVTLQLYDHGVATGRKGACCAGQDIHDARRVADHLRIPHYVIDAEQRFVGVHIDDVEEAILVLIAFLTDQPTLQQLLVRAGEVGERDLDVVPVIPGVLAVGLAIRDLAVG